MSVIIIMDNNALVCLVSGVCMLSKTRIGTAMSFISLLSCREAS